MPMFGIVGILRFFLRWINLIVWVTFILAACNPFLSLEKWLGAGFLGIIFPYTLILVLILAILDFIFLPRWGLVCVIILAIFSKQIMAIFALNLSGLWKFKQVKDERDIRVMTWNVRRFQPLSSNNVYLLNLSHEHRQLLQNYHPDILCMQEYITQEPVLRANYDVEGYMRRTLGYPYSFFVKDYSLPKNLHSGNVIYSKYPILHSAVVNLYSEKNNSAQNPATIYTDILYNTDTLRVVVVHLESFRLKNREYKDIEKIRNQHGAKFATYEGLFRKIRSSFVVRTYQAEHLAEFVKNSPYPVILAGDFNDVPLSYTYYTVRGDIMQDAFLEKGFGIGSTYIKLLPMLRIDYIFCSKDWQVEQTEVISDKISDHLALVSDLRLKH